MSFMSNVFVVDSLERFKKFCATVAIEHDVVQEYDGGSAAVCMFSDDQVEPPCSFIYPGTNHEVDIDFHTELKKLLAKGEKVHYRVEYEVTMDENGEVEYLCEGMAGMPPKEGDSNGNQSVYPGAVCGADLGGAF